MKTKILFFILTLSGVNYIPVANATLSLDEVQLINYIDKNKTNQLKLLERLVNINSGTGNKKGVEKVGELIRPEFESLGFKTQWINLPSSMKHAGSLVATHSGPGKKILLIGHLDTRFSLPADFFSHSRFHQIKNQQQDRESLMIKVA
ncbi:MAG: hypothetical protein ACL7BU_06565 [Candidatus Phlomobacter fragariae]